MKAHTAVMVQCDGTEQVRVHHSGPNHFMVNVGDLVHIVVTHAQGSALHAALGEVVEPPVVTRPDDPPPMGGAMWIPAR